MVFGLVGLLFNLVTFPGILINGGIERAIAAVLGAPMATVAIDERIDDETQLFEMDDREVRRYAERLEEGESAPEGMRREFVVNYAGVDSYAGVVAVVVGPFFVCSALTLGLYFVAVPMQLLWDPLMWVLGYLGFAIGAHAFPNGGAADALLRRTRQDGGPLAFVGYPVVVVSKLVNLLEFVWLDAIFALLLWFAVRDLVWGAVLSLL